MDQARQSPGRVMTSAGATSEAARARVVAWASALREHQHQPSTRGVPGPDVGCGGDEVEVDAHGRDHDHRCAVGIGADRSGGHGVLDPVPGQRALDGDQLGRPDDRRIGHEPTAQPALGTEPVQGMRLGSGAANGAHGVDDRCQRLRGRDLAVEHGEGLAIVSAHPHLHPGAVLVLHDAGDLEALDLAHDRPVLDDDVGR